MTKYRVANESEIMDGVPTSAFVAGHRLCLARVPTGDICALSDICSHEGAYLSEGEVFGDSVVCPGHGSLFDLRTGMVTGFPAMEPVEAFRVHVEAGVVYVDIG